MMVKRYSYDFADEEFQEQPDGEWVRYEEYEQLLNDLKAVEKNVDAIMDKHPSQPEG